MYLLKHTSELKTVFNQWNHCVIERSWEFFCPDDKWMQTYVHVKFVTNENTQRSMGNLWKTCKMFGTRNWHKKHGGKNENKWRGCGSNAIPPTMASACRKQRKGKSHELRVALEEELRVLRLPRWKTSPTEGTAEARGPRQRKRGFLPTNPWKALLFPNETKPFPNSLGFRLPTK